MHVSQVNGNHTKKALQKTKEVCAEAFRLISSEDARREGFFGCTEPIIETVIIERLRGQELPNAPTPPGDFENCHPIPDNTPAAA